MIEKGLFLTFKQHFFTRNAGLLVLPPSPPRWRFLLRAKRSNDLQPHGLENFLPALHIIRVQILVQIKCRSVSKSGCDKTCVLVSRSLPQSRGKVSAKKGQGLAAKQQSKSSSFPNHPFSSVT